MCIQAETWKRPRQELICDKFSLTLGKPVHCRSKQNREHAVTIVTQQRYYSFMLEVRNKLLKWHMAVPYAVCHIGICTQWPSQTTNPQIQVAQEHC